MVRREVGLKRRNKVVYKKVDFRKEKQCWMCRKIKPIKEFDKCIRRTRAILKTTGKLKIYVYDGYQTKCKECVNTYYTKNKKRFLETNRINRIKYRRSRQENIYNYLSKHPCVDCGEKDIVVLEFDHVKGRKKFNVSEGINYGWAWKTIFKEIKKCEVRCANCHKRKTAKIFGWWKAEK